MTLRRLQVTDFRCLQQVDMEFDPRFTLISGPNASGKTSLLEAIYLLGRGRSFRTRRTERLVRSGRERLVVFGEVEASGRRVAIGVEASAAGVRAQLSGERAASLADLALIFPVQVIDPEIHRLIEEGPTRRRRFLDWGVFHVEPAFVIYWQKYRQALRQRNAALKARQPRSMVSIWDSDLVRHGERMTDARSRYVARLAPLAAVLGRELLGMELSLNYKSGWAQGSSLSDALEHSWSADQEAGSTQVGPQRAELAIRLDGAPVKDRISRGQQKLLAAVLLVSQIQLFSPDSPGRPTLLLDDPAAELDSDHLAELIETIRIQAVQLVVTTLHADFSGFGAPGRHLSLEHGKAIDI
jgi:DNA replication and repair protein RecF